MINKIKRIYHYIQGYSQIKSKVKLVDDKEAFPFIEDYYIRNEKYSQFNQSITKEKLLSQLQVFTHTIEKGLAKSNLRLGFGQERVMQVIQLINLYRSNYDDIPNRLIISLSTLLEYKELHNNNQYPLPYELEDNLHKLLSAYNFLEPNKQNETTKTSFYKDIEAPFPSFSSSRHSVREFSGNPVNKEVIAKSIQLAQNAPSTCNRQSTRLYVVYDKEKLKTIASLQMGGRGFAEKANPFIVVTSELQDWSYSEMMNGPFIDAGIYIMNLLYSLHYNGVGTCPINWYVPDLQIDKKLRKALAIPDSQVVICLIACGDVVNKFKVVKSQRRNYEEIVNFI